jgi:hypothetical protein
LASAGKLKAILTSGGELKANKEELKKIFDDVCNDDSDELEIDLYLHKKIIQQDLPADKNVNIDTGEVEFLSKKLGLDKNSTSSFLNSFGSLKSHKVNR